jgi:hypothetical protein
VSKKKQTMSGRRTEAPQVVSLPLALGSDGGLAWPLYDA